MVAEKAKSGRGGRRIGSGRKPSLHSWLKLEGNFFYVLHESDSDRICKIGIASRPFTRLGTHQISNWRRLRMALLYSCPSAQIASSLESYICITLRGRHVLGEWFEATPAEIECEVSGFSSAHGIQLLRIDVNDYRRDPYERHVTQKAGSGG